MKRATALLAVIACAACTDGRPVVADMATVSLRIPRDQEFTAIHFSDRNGRGQRLEQASVSFNLCDQHLARPLDTACDLHGRFGTRVIVREPPADAVFALLTERPQEGEAPPDTVLTPLPEIDRSAPLHGRPDAAENNALGWVSSPVLGDEPWLSTTDRGWPVADCDPHPQGGIGCRFGFLIRGTPVVAQWFSPQDQGEITQAQVWEVASDIDRRVRRLIVSDPS